MSRIGNRKLVIPAGVTVTIDGNTVTVKGPKGELTNEFNKLIKIEQVDNEIICSRDNDAIFTKSIHGTTNSLIENMIKELEAVGVGYRFAVAGNKITVTAGYSHPVIVEVPAGLSVESKVNTELTISGIDKQKVSEFAANIRKIRKPEP